MAPLEPLPLIWRAIYVFVLASRVFSPFRDQVWDRAMAQRVSSSGTDPPGLAASSAPVFILFFGRKGAPFPLQLSNTQTPFPLEARGVDGPRHLAPATKSVMDMRLSPAILEFLGCLLVGNPASCRKLRLAI